MGYGASIVLVLLIWGLGTWRFTVGDVAAGLLLVLLAAFGIALLVGFYYRRSQAQSLKESMLELLGWLIQP